MNKQPTSAPTTQPLIEVGFLRSWDIIGCKKRGIVPLIPVSKSIFLAGVDSGIFPKPIYLGQRTKVWTIKSIRDFIENGGVL